MVVETGVGGLKVRDLAASLGATTGSLYWHFEDRRSLELALLRHWAKGSTEEIAQRVESSSATPEERLWKLLVLIQENAPTTADVAIRSWAVHDEEAAAIVGRVDERRAGVVRGLFRGMGFRGDELQMRTQMLLCYESCERFVVSGLSPRKRRELLRARHELYCRG